LEDPIDDKWLNFILNLVFQLSSVKYHLEKFNEKNFKNKTSDYLTPSKIKEIIKFWIEEKWFEDISKQCSNDINISLRLLNQFIGYNIQSVISSIIHIVEMKLKNDEKEISKIILDFPQYLNYGLKNRFQLDLIELGFTDRIGVIKLSKFLKDKIEYNELKDLKKYLYNNKKNIFEHLKKTLPVISLNKIQKAFDYLDFEPVPDF